MTNLITFFLCHILYPKLQNTCQTGVKQALGQSTGDIFFAARLIKDQLKKNTFYDEIIEIYLSAKETHIFEMLDNHSRRISIIV